MSRRSSATVKRPATHVFIADPVDRRSCVSCQLPERNSVHQLPQASSAAREQDARRLGEHDEEPW